MDSAFSWLGQKVIVDFRPLSAVQWGVDYPGLPKVWRCSQLPPPRHYRSVQSVPNTQPAARSYPVHALVPLETKEKQVYTLFSSPIGILGTVRRLPPSPLCLWYLGSAWRPTNPLLPSNYCPPSQSIYESYNFQAKPPSRLLLERLQPNLTAAIVHGAWPSTNKLYKTRPEDDGPNLLVSARVVSHFPCC